MVTGKYSNEIFLSLAAVIMSVFSACNTQENNSLTEKEKAEAEKKFREINDAYTILSDDEKRNEYDKMAESKNGYGKNKKSRAKTEKEDYGDIYEKFTKEGMNSMFGKFFDPEKKSSEKGDSKMKEQTNNMFESFFSFNGRKKK